MAPPKGEAGYLIHRRPYQERALLVEIFTLNYGRVDAVLRMNRKNEMLMQALLQPYSPLFFELQFGRSDLAVIKGVYQGESGAPLPMPEIFCADYLNELLHYLYREHEGNPELFGAYIAALEGLRRRGDAEALLRSFEEALLKTLGYVQDFKNPVAGEWRDEVSYAYVAGRGFVEATDDLQDEASFKGRILNELASGRRDSTAALRCCKRINTAIIAALLNGRKLKSRELYRSYLKDVG